MASREILITEVALRDGSHAIAHQFTTDQVVKVAKALDEANVPYIEVTHGDGLAGSSLQYGLSRTNEMELIEAGFKIMMAFPFLAPPTISSPRAVV